MSKYLEIDNNMCKIDEIKNLRTGKINFNLFTFINIVRNINL